MPRATLETRPTLDEIFGLESEDIVRRQDAIARIDAELMACEQERSSIQEEFYKFLHGYKENKNNIYFRIRTIEDYTVKLGIKIDKLNKISYRYEELSVTCFWRVSRVFGITLFPSLKSWMFRTICYQSNINIEAERRIEWLVERLSAFALNAAQFSADRHLSAIAEAIASLRRPSPMATLGMPSAPPLHDLIGELLSPHVLAAGTGLGLFTTRC